MYLSVPIQVDTVSDTDFESFSAQNERVNALPRTFIFSKSVKLYNAFYKEQAYIPCRDAGDVLRFDNIESFTKKVLAFFSIEPHTQNYDFLYVLFSASLKNPRLDIKKLLYDAAHLVDIEVYKIDPILSKSFNMYNEQLRDKFTRVIGTSPYTSKDAVCDIVCYMRDLYYGC